MRYQRLVAEKQVLFRLEGRLLDKLDKKLAQEGYKTRNRWFREFVSGYLGGRGGGARRKASARRR
jgi:metal-responsive CopG/Arc/MetJ family transcriptional regulator